MKPQKSFWEETYKRNIEKLIGVCFRYVQNIHLAEDLAHNSFLKAMDNSTKFKGKGHFDAWLRTITVNTTIQYIRDENKVKEKNTELQKDLQIIYDSTPNEWQQFTIKELLIAINLLPEHHKLVFNMYVLDGFTHKQISEILDISEGTSKSHLARARKRLQQILTEKKKEKRYFLFFLPANLKIDKLYKKKFSNFVISPTNHISFTTTTEFTNANLPVIGFFGKNIFILLAISSVIIFTIFELYFNQKTEKINNEQQKKHLLEITSKKNNISSKNSKILKKKVKPKPIIIKKKRIVKQKIIIRDTININDTANVK